MTLTEAELEENRRLSRLATKNAKAVLRVGDRVSRHFCSGRTGTFVFSGWQNTWGCWKGDFICGRDKRTVPTQAINIYAVNGKLVDFTKE